MSKAPFMLMPDLHRSPPSFAIRNFSRERAPVRAQTAHAEPW